MIPGMQWYYSENGSQAGPISELELRGKITAGSVTAEDLVWRDGMEDWQKVASVPELSNALPSQISPSSPPEVQSGQDQSPYQPPVTQSPVNLSHHAGGEIQSYLWQSIVVTILCCWPLGIPAIVYAAKVDGLKRTGDLNGAAAASASAKSWCLIAFWLGLISNLAFVALMFFAEA